MTDAALPPPAGQPGAYVHAASHLDARGAVDWVKVLLGFGGMVVGQFMAMLDIQIVASSLPQIQSGIGASADEIAWVQTIYLLAEVVIMPLTAYMTKMWGTRRFYVAAAVAFVVSSMLTGLSTTFEFMILTRALQGLAAGAMIPPVFATAMTVFPPERRVTANVVVGMLVTLAPTIGPTLGGHLTEVLTWRWLFFINIPPGLLAIFLVSRYGGFDKGDPSLSKGIDWWGLGLLTVFLLSMQYVFEEGAADGWLKDDLILWLTVTAVVAGVAFIWRQLTYWQPIVSLKPFQDRNFSLGMLVSLVAGMSMFGGTFVIPLFLAQVLRYSSGEVGTTMLAGGLSMLVAAPLLAPFVRRVDPRVAIVTGFLISAFAMVLGASINANWSFWDFALMQGIRSVGIMVAMIASQQLTVATIPPSLMKDASGLVNLIRNVGGAVGLAILSSVITHQTASHYSELASGVNLGNMVSQDFLAGMTAMMEATGRADPDGAARKVMGMLLHRQAAVLAFADAFYVLCIGSVLAAVIGAFSKPVAGTTLNLSSGGH